MNPYRKALLRIDEAWPWWILNRHYHPEFAEGLKDGCIPQAAWLEIAPSSMDLFSGSP